MFELKQIKDKIYLLSFDSQYELAMHFLRAQEYYECPNPAFRNKRFKLIDYIDWYAKKHGGVFSYTTDWIGFNIPGRVLHNTYNVNDKSDMGPRDFFMAQVLGFLSSVENGTYNFYLLGAADNNPDTIQHELAHAFWDTNQKYITMQNANLNALKIADPATWQKLRGLIIDMGYNASVASDEMQAYLSTGMYSAWATDFSTTAWNKFAKPFISTFKDYR